MVNKPMRNCELSIALCTHNGAEFLDRQLGSLLRQTLVPSELVVCDDASADSSLTMVYNYLKNAPFPVKVNRNSQPLGVVANYSQAISLCSGRYIALCDQDDIWFPEKLKHTMQRMKEAEKKYGNSVPLLVHTDLTVIDNAENITASSFFGLRKLKPFYRDPLKTLLFQNFVTGCTVLINRPLVEAALPVPDGAIMHDWWLALIAAARGNIIFIPQSTVYYRRHDNNVMDLHPFYSFYNLKKMSDSKKFSLSIAEMIIQAQNLQENLDLLPGIKKVTYLDHFVSASFKSGWQAALVALRYGIGKVGPFRNAAFLYHLFKGDYINVIK